MEIDKSMFGNKQKYKCGRVSEGQWVFGMVERDFLVFRVPDHQQETLVTSAQVHLTWHRDHF